MIADQHGTQHKARALLDSASQFNFMTKGLAQKLNLDKVKTSTYIGGIGESRCKANFSINATLTSRTSEYITSLEFLILPKITSMQPAQEININNWNLPNNIKLADPHFNIPQRIDLLIGADVFFNLFKGEQINLGSGNPVLLNTEFRWIISGKCTSFQTTQCALLSTTIETERDYRLDSLVQKFWEMEKVPEGKPRLSHEHSECENHFKKFTKRLPSGWFMVKLPLKAEPTSLGDSKFVALRRFFMLEKRLISNQQLKQAYEEFLTQYETDGHMTPVNWPSTNIGHYFLPHHCVHRPEKSTTKCRVVFDASAKACNNLSLNDIMMVGPVVQNELCDILLRFRLHKYGLMADITAMYRQILVYPEDQLLQNILWRKNVSSDVALYQLKTVTYGTAAEPFLATRCLTQLAEDIFANNPTASAIIKNDFYVDDLITGGATLHDLQTIKTDVIELLQRAQFQLRKWHSNHKEFLASIAETER